MDRLPAVMLVLLACSGGESKPPPPPPASRVDAVAAPPMRETAVAEFCDSTTAMPFTLPELDAAAPVPATGWTWLNVWATWCGPCVAEMPMIRGWAKKLAEDGVALDLRFLSVDASAADLDRYKTTHPDMPPTMRVKEFGVVAPWFTALGLPASTAIPLHLFVDPAGNVQCERAGAVNEADYLVIKKIVTRS